MAAASPWHKPTHQVSPAPTAEQADIYPLGEWINKATTVPMTCMSEKRSHPEASEASV